MKILAAVGAVLALSGCSQEPAPITSPPPPLQ